MTCSLHFSAAYDSNVGQDEFAMYGISAASTWEVFTDLLKLQMTTHSSDVDRNASLGPISQLYGIDLFILF
jgi:hypothetical protein